MRGDCADVLQVLAVPLLCGLQCLQLLAVFAAGVTDGLFKAIEALRQSVGMCSHGPHSFKGLGMFLLGALEGLQLLGVPAARVAESLLEAIEALRQCGSVRGERLDTLQVLGVLVHSNPERLEFQCILIRGALECVLDIGHALCHGSVAHTGFLEGVQVLAMPHVGCVVLGLGSLQALQVLCVPLGCLPKQPLQAVQSLQGRGWRDCRPWGLALPAICRVTCELLQEGQALSERGTRLRPAALPQAEALLQFPQLLASRGLPRRVSLQLFAQGCEVAGESSVLFPHEFQLVHGCVALV
mmetsp:Transcript_53554/g.171627  ORF Transcript_53554/g.171627 Transcript_53554/m.171627 type:complete len:298 (+) Transcript_53554:2600-3493(+)